MKISKQRLKQIIKEEMQRTFEGDAPPASNVESGEEETKSMAAFAKFLKDLNFKVRGGEIKGLDTTEIKLLAPLINMLIELSASKSASAQLKLLLRRVGKLGGPEAQ